MTTPPGNATGQATATPEYRCPCCRYRTLVRPKSYEMCPVCYWEDDGQDDAAADEVWGGPNGSLSLTEARRNFARCGASDPKYVLHVRPPMEAER